MAVAARTPADLVLSGGGVKGVGLVGAVAALIDAGYAPQRVSGTSAGSIVGAIVAAASKHEGVTGEQVKEIALGIDYRKFLDPCRIGRVPLVGPAVAMVRGNGIYRGDYAHAWIRGELKNLGVDTFGDLAVHDDSLPEERRYKLVVTVADLTRGELVRLPWDCRRVYGRDPDEQSVAHAVRASMSIPYGTPSCPAHAPSTSRAQPARLTCPRPAPRPEMPRQQTDPRPATVKSRPERNSRTIPTTPLDRRALQRVTPLQRWRWYSRCSYPNVPGGC